MHSGIETMFHVGRNVCLVGSHGHPCVRGFGVHFCCSKVYIFHLSHRMHSKHTKIIWKIDVSSSHFAQSTRRKLRVCLDPRCHSWHAVYWCSVLSFVTTIKTFGAKALLAVIPIGPDMVGYPAETNHHCFCCVRYHDWHCWLGDCTIMQVHHASRPVCMVSYIPKKK